MTREAIARALIVIAVATWAAVAWVLMETFRW